MLTEISQANIRTGRTSREANEKRRTSGSRHYKMQDAATLRGNCQKGTWNNFQYARYRNPRCVWMELVVRNFIQLVYVLIPRVANLCRIMKKKADKDF